jgi:hypothetical protein
MFIFRNICEKNVIKILVITITRWKIVRAGLEQEHED